MTSEITQATESLTLEPTTVLSNNKDFNLKHPLNSKWTLWYTKPPVDKSESWSDLLRPVIAFQSVEEFWGIYNSIPKAEDLPIKSDYHLFREDIRPEWEDESNAKGGKWQFQFKGRTAGINELWLRSLLALIGETIDDEEDAQINGVVINVRKVFYRVALWTKSCDEEKLKAIGAKFKAVLKLGEEDKLEFYSHTSANEKAAKPLIML